MNISNSRAQSETFILAAHQWGWGLVLAAIILLEKAPLPMDIPISGGGLLWPVVLVFCVATWTHSGIGALQIFIAGLLRDILVGLPLGLTGFLLLGVWWLVGSQRRWLISSPFWVNWAGFGFVMVACVVLEWVLFLLFALSNQLSASKPPQAYITDVLLMFAVFPILTNLSLIPMMLMSLTGRGGLRR